LVKRSNITGGKSSTFIEKLYWAWNGTGSNKKDQRMCYKILIRTQIYIGNFDLAAEMERPTDDRQGTDDSQGREHEKGTTVLRGIG
jgi:hypothetical protein